MHFIFTKRPRKVWFERCGWLCFITSFYFIYCL